MATPQTGNRPVPQNQAKPAVSNATPATPTPVAAAPKTEAEIAAAKAKAKAEKEARFKDIAAARTVKILKTLDLLANCSSTNNYVYTEAQIKTIFGSIQEKVNEVKDLFNPTAGKAKEDYKISL